jgi:hypothetical protein
VLDEAVEEDGAVPRRDERHDTILASYQTLGLRMAALLELGLVLASERDPPKLLDLFCEGAQDIMSCRIALVAVLDAEERRVHSHASRGLSDEAIAHLGTLKPTAGVFGEILADGKPRRLRDADVANAKALDALIPGAVPTLIVPLPLRSTAAVRGWLCFADRI